MEATIRVPGKFMDFFSGTSVAQGQHENYSADPATNAAAARLHEAYQSRRQIRVGKGWAVEFDLDPEAAEILRQYAEWNIDCQLFGDRDFTEIRAAAKVIERITGKSYRIPA